MSEEVELTELHQPSEDVLRLLYETMNDGVVAFDSDGRIVFCNPAMAMLVGVKCQDLVGKTASEAWGGERIELPDETSSTGGHFLLQRADGTVRHVIARSFYIRTVPPLQVAIYRDVTRWRMVENTLRGLLSTSLVSGRETFFHRLLSELVRVLRVKYAFVGTIDTEDPLLLHVEACWVDKAPGEPFACRLEGSPCEKLSPDTICFYRAGAYKLFPRDLFLQEHRIEGFLGAPLVDCEGKVIGVLVAMDQRPLTEIYDSKAIIALFAAHAAMALAQFESTRELREAQQRYDALVEQAREGIYLRDLAPVRILFANKMLVDMFGYEREELLKLHPLEAVAPPLRERMGRLVAKMIETRRPHLLRFIAQRKNGTQFVAELLPGFVTYKGRPCLQATVRDVTERYRAEQERRLLARLAVRLAGDDTIERVAKTVEEITRELFDWDAYCFVVRRPGEERRRVVEYVDTIDGVKQVFPGGIEETAASGPMRRVLSGEPVILDVSEQGSEPSLRPFGDSLRHSKCLLYVPIRVPAGVLGVISIQSYQERRYNKDDLSLLLRVADTVAPALERVRAEQQIRESEERYRRLIELLPFAIFVLVERRIRYVNPAGIRLLGVSHSEDLLDIDFLDLVADNVRDSLAERLSSLSSQEGQIPPVEFEIVRFDGKRILVESREIPTTYKDEQAVQVVLQDVTEQKEYLRRILSSEQQLKLLFEQTPLAVIRWDRDFRVTDWNPAAEQIFGYSRAEAIGKHALETIVPPASQEHVLQVWQALLSMSGGLRSTNFNVTKDGRMILCEWYNTPLTKPDGTVIGVASLVQDVTERETMARALQESEERYSLAVQGANDGIWDWDLKSGIVYYSPRWKEILGIDRNAELKTPEEWFSRVHPDDSGMVKDAIASHLEKHADHLEIEFRMKHQDGHYLWVLCRGLAVCDENDIPVRMAGSLTDISARKQAEEQMLFDALHDRLTGLPNRVLFSEHLQHSMSIALRDLRYCFAVLLLGLDRFKLVNESLGHKAGDELLQAIGRRLQERVRRGDIVARLSADQFLVLLDDIRSIEEAEELAQSVRALFDESFRLSTGDIYVTASGGLVVPDRSYTTSDEIIRDAEIAMFRAKTLGKNRIETFSPELRVRIQSRLQLETDLHRALRHHQFEVLYQPIVRLADDTVWGFEAIVRWRHPQRGTLLPFEFIEVAEETGLIVSLGQEVFREACSQLEEWSSERGHGWHVSINVSARQLTHEDFLRDISSLLERTDIAPERIVIELTESMFIAEHETVREAMQFFRERGLRLAVDDFGTGYSSLAYLQRFPVDILKIDRAFITNLGTQHHKLEIVQTIWNLAKNLNIDVVAEGVENSEQHTQLAALGIPYAQGFWYAQPLDPKRAYEFAIARERNRLF